MVEKYTVAQFDEHTTPEFVEMARTEMKHALAASGATENVRVDGPRWFDPPEVAERFFGLVARGEQADG